MSDETNSIPAKTWARAADPISKVGYMDGATDGRANTFQSSFDEGYKLGFHFGLEIGCREASLRTRDQMESSSVLADTRKINCQICMNPDLSKEDLGNLFNIQKENKPWPKKTFFR